MSLIITRWIINILNYLPVLIWTHKIPAFTADYVRFLFFFSLVSPQIAVRKSLV